MPAITATWSFGTNAAEGDAALITYKALHAPHGWLLQITDSRTKETQLTKLDSRDDVEAAVRDAFPKLLGDGYRLRNAAGFAAHVDPDVAILDQAGTIERSYEFKRDDDSEPRSVTLVRGGTTHAPLRVSMLEESESETDIVFFSWDGDEAQRLFDGLVSHLVNDGFWSPQHCGKVPVAPWKPVAGALAPAFL